MPSPFPGMDPYLEHPEYFPNFHGRYLFHLEEVLNQTLPKTYVAKTGTRVWIEYAERIVEPDIDILRLQRASGKQADQNGGGVAVAVNIRPVVVHVPQDEHREAFLEIRTVQGDRRLVTAVELLSLSNKTVGDQGRQLYERKQREVLASQANLVEIDLLRDGVHCTAVPRDRALAEAGRFDYHVCIHRFFAPGQYLVYPILLEQRLPWIEIPLLPTEAPITLDLQGVFEQCYDRGPYAREAIYSKSTLQPPLTPAQTEWAERLLRENNLLPPA